MDGCSFVAGHGKRSGDGPPLDYAPNLFEKKYPLQIVSKMLRANGASLRTLPKLNKRAQQENNELRKMVEEYSKGENSNNCIKVVRNGNYTIKVYAESSPEKSLDDSG